MPIYNNKYTFLHIPRTGGTLIEHKLRENHSESYNGIDSLGLSMQHYTLDNLISDKDRNNLFIFTFVRNPFDKILSTYLNWSKNNTPDFDKYIDMVKNVVENKLYLYKGSINTNDISHFTPITVMIGDNKLDFIGKFENYENDIKKLYEMSGIKNLNEITIKKRNIDYRTFYSERNKKIINELYKDDLKEFNYTF
tara:strand:- start:1857 stop:2441 length:585 start_codon:yes stop_codon:yes gene_type:complete